MLVIRIELWGAVTGKRTELGFMTISNIGGTGYRGNYEVRLARNLGRMRAGKVWRTATLSDFPRRSLGVFDLTLRALLWAVGDRNRKELDLARKHHEAPCPRCPEDLARLRRRE